MYILKYRVYAMSITEKVRPLPSTSEITQIKPSVAFILHHKFILLIDKWNSILCIPSARTQFIYSSSSSSCWLVVWLIGSVFIENLLCLLDRMAHITPHPHTCIYTNTEAEKTHKLTNSLGQHHLSFWSLARTLLQITYISLLLSIYI